MTNWTASSTLYALAIAERERRDRRRRSVRVSDIATFIRRASIEVPHAAGVWVQPFDLWPAQQEVLSKLETDRLLMLLKARQIGMTWLTCAYVLWHCLAQPYTTVLLFSQGQLEANELIRRMAFLYHTHADPLPNIAVNNITELSWVNGSRVKSLPATRKAGRSFTASIVVLDEFAFMQWGSELLAAVKPTIDNGGQLIILSSADGNGSAFHQLWQAAESQTNGFTPLFLDWMANPTRGPDWRDARKAEGVSESDVLREYPANSIEAFTHASGLVYDVWSDGPLDGNVTEEAEYIPDGGPIYYGNDDGYAGAIDPKSGYFVAGSHPRVFLFVQEKSDGHLDVFDEDYRVKTEVDPHLVAVFCAPLALADVRSEYEISAEITGSDLIDRLRIIRERAPDRFYAEPDYIAADNASATAIGIMTNRGFYIRKKPASVEESIKNTRRMIAPDENGWRRIRVHPRCKHLRAEMTSYRNDPVSGKPIDEFDHGPSALRYLAWTKRLEG